MRSHNRFCREKAISIKYDEYVSVFLPQISGMQVTSFISRFLGKKYFEHKMCLLILSFV
jgi:hypothetical protein